MALSEQDLEEAIIALRYAADGGVFPTGDRLFVEAVKPLVEEMRRRKHGPFTLAEAVASGRPFRRKGQPVWIKPSSLTEEGPSWLHQRGGGDWEPYLVDTATGWLEEANEFTSDDITACDYELQEGGE